MSDAGGFQVAYSATLREHIKNLVVTAKERDVRLASNLLTALQVLDGKMRSAPYELGEPRFSYPHLHLNARVAVQAPLAVSFAVHEDKPIVFVQTVQLLEGN